MENTAYNPNEIPLIGKRLRSHRRAFAGLLIFSVIAVILTLFSGVTIGVLIFTIPLTFIERSYVNKNKKKLEDIIESMLKTGKSNEEIKKAFTESKLPKDELVEMIEMIKAKLK